MGIAVFFCIVIARGEESEKTPTLAGFTLFTIGLPGVILFVTAAANNLSSERLTPEECMALLCSLGLAGLATISSCCVAYLPTDESIWCEISLDIISMIVSLFVAKGAPEDSLVVEVRKAVAEEEDRKLKLDLKSMYTPVYIRREEEAKVKEEFFGFLRGGWKLAADRISDKSVLETISEDANDEELEGIINDPLHQMYWIYRIRLARDGLFDSHDAEENGYVVYAKPNENYEDRQERKKKYKNLLTLIQTGLKDYVVKQTVNGHLKECRTPEEFDFATSLVTYRAKGGKEYALPTVLLYNRKLKDEEN